MRHLISTGYLSLESSEAAAYVAFALALGFRTMSPESLYALRRMQRALRRIGASYPQDLMEVTAEPVREECLKGLLNGEAVFALVRSQVSTGDEGIEPCLGHTNRKPLKFVIVVPRSTCR